ncbi:hypothetical protein F444_11053 [Phytophthora nicotianae P1976]|uniref:Uncharacterized protein n=1 Tax=Phytophthora nicotianae P1976 TaxID=1317066 RepID=A0A081A253_PHYNI|nr:hypothetical protein F444_11053 [Phytophthora nicotianae P1976]
MNNTNNRLESKGTLKSDICLNGIVWRVGCK